MSRIPPPFNPDCEDSADRPKYPVRPAPVPFRSHNAPQCVVCGNALTVAEQAVGKACSRPECKNRFVREQAQAEMRRQRELHDRAVAAEQMLVRSKALAENAPEHPVRIRGVLPSNERRLVGLSKRRIGVFVDRLMGIISQAAAIQFGNAELEDDGVGYDKPNELSPTELAILGNGCAVCRGHCCSQGNGHAFIHVDTILGYMRRNPDQRPRDVLEAYVSRIGRKAYEDSCVYHAENGCTLPREMRSKVCNGYLCKGLDHILHQLHETQDTQRPVDLIDACEAKMSGKAPAAGNSEEPAASALPLNKSTGREVFVISVSDYYKCDSDQENSTRAAVIDASGVLHYDLDAAASQNASGDVNTSHHHAPQEA